MEKVGSPVLETPIAVPERDFLAGGCNGVGPSTTTKLGDARTENTSVL